MTQSRCGFVALFGTIKTNVCAMVNGMLHDDVSRQDCLTHTSNRPWRLGASKDETSDHDTSGCRYIISDNRMGISRLVNHPEVLKKARAEIDANVGQDHLIDEPDISKLHYLQAIISETF
ncbi:hypothetical protein HYC85_002577 [Camellia sinensis]|uniref:Uncharacterized protein n=1 Tax=Camellia sinensis TaxID=4442 RepID=A0A7J7IAW6_CAMSI|nr:hypothetical protein HYC85_002577 [Camellia sinensis]